MKESFLKKIFRTITEEYDFFSHLSVASRIGITLSFTLLYFTLVVLIHLTLYPYLAANPKAISTIGTFYIFVLIIAILTMLPILFPKLKKKSSIAISIILIFNFFPLAILAFLVPQLRKHKTTVIGVLVYLSIIAAGFMIMLNGVNEGVLIQQPDTTIIVLWFVGMIFIFSSIFIHSFVTEKISVEKTQIETEVKIAQDIQSHLVPVIELQKESYKVFGKMKSAYQIGGDFFDLVELTDHKLVVAIGDVSGHNIAAGLLMAIAKSSFRTALQHTSSLTELVESMNRTIFDNSDKKMFVTFKGGMFDFTKHSITVVNAGHLPLLHYNSQTNHILEYNQYGLALGLSDKASYTSQQINFNRGDIFALVTDGIVEARDPSGSEFSFERIKNMIKSFASQRDLKTLYEKLMTELYDFTESKSFHDDTTFLSIRIL